MIYADAYDVGGPISVEQGQAEDCPLCLAVKGSPCVALTDKFEYEQSKYRRNWGVPKKLVRAKGTPLLDYCHPERRSLVRARFRRERQAAERRARKAALGRVRGPSADALAARAAMQAWDAAEHMRLREWLAAYGDILVNASDRPGA